MAAYQDALNRTSTAGAPWFVVPANKKWYRNLVVATVLVDTLEEMRPHYQETNVDLRQVVIE
jgi:polyphosphate kinase 2 (PPK2 family)